MILFVLFVVAFVFDGAAYAQSNADAPTVTGTLSNITRVESWSYFTPPPQVGSDPTYTFLADRAELGVRVDAKRFDIAGAFNYVRIENLPSHAIGPGGLGAGAFYFAAADVPYSYQLYLSELLLRAKSSDGRFSASIGRLHYASGLESSARSPVIDRLKRERLASRLIGDFEWSHYQRRFDGIRVDADRPSWHATGSVFMPTQGGFEESANLTTPRIKIASATLTKRSSTQGEWQAFAHAYRDRRRSMAQPDNSGSTDGPVNVTIAALGGSFASVSSTPVGEFDLVLWGAAELGDWYGQDQRAASVVIEGGHRWTHRTLRPWIRGGYAYATGDRNPLDNRHGTFFPMLPSSRKYALSSAYAQMNLKDAFVQAWVEPPRFSARVELHRVDLASGADLWYEGSGATASNPARFFGFAGRPANGVTSLGTILESVAQVPIKRHWSINGYAGTMWGGDVVKRSFHGNRFTMGFVENVIAF